MIKFTIATCTFNAEECLERTLDSVLSQTYHEVEHLIIDGASTDKTLSMAEAYKEESDASECYHDVVIASEPDNGLYDAMNKAIGKATGDYILFLNAGDTFPSENTLEAISGMVGEGEALPGVLYGDTDIVDSEGRFLRHRHLSAPKKLSWRSFIHGMVVCHQAFYARTDLAKATPYDLRYRYSADVDWCIRIMKAAGKQHLALKNMDAVVAHYLEGGMSIEHHQASLKERFSVMRYHYGLIPTAAMHAWFVVRQYLRK